MKVDKQGEALSALMDGEHTELELRQLLASLDDTPAASWARWHLVQDVLQGHAASPHVDMTFCAGISAAIANEPRHSQRAVWGRSLSRVAVAASVALAMVAGWQVWQLQGASSIASTPTIAASGQGLHQMAMPVSDRLFLAPKQALSSGGAANEAFGRNGAMSVQPVSDSFVIDADSRFNRMMERHSRAAANQGVQGMMPYVRMIDFDARRQR